MNFNAICIVRGPPLPKMKLNVFGVESERPKLDGEAKFEFVV